MTFTQSLLCAGAIAFALPAWAEISVSDAYARVSTAMSTSGAAFLAIHNSGPEEDRLIGVKSTVAARTELHTHKADANGMMQMLHVPEGFPIPAGGLHLLERGGDHVMFMGLQQRLAHGDTVHLTLVFEKAGEIEIDVPVDLERGTVSVTGAQMQTMQGAPEGMAPQHQHQN